MAHRPDRRNHRLLEPLSGIYGPACVRAQQHSFTASELRLVSRTCRQFAVVITATVNSLRGTPTLHRPLPRHHRWRHHQSAERPQADSYSLVRHRRTGESPSLMPAVKEPPLRRRFQQEHESFPQRNRPLWPDAGTGIRR